MKRVTLGLLLIAVILLAISCSSDAPTEPVSSAAEQSQSSAAKATTVQPDQQSTSFEHNLIDFFQPKVNTVYAFEGSDISAKVVVAARNEMDDVTVYQYEGEYYADAEQVIDYFNAAYQLSEGQLAQIYYDDTFDQTPDYQTVWLKSPVESGDSWRTTYYDRQAGFVDATVTVELAGDDVVAVRLDVDDATADAATRSLKRSFVGGDPLLGGSLLGDALYWRDDCLTNTKVYAYQSTNSTEMLKRFYSEISYIKYLFEEDPVVEDYYLGSYKQAVRKAQKNSEVADLMVEYIAAQLDDPTEPHGFGKMRDAFNYALKHVDKQFPIVELFAHTMINSRYYVMGEHAQNYIYDYASNLKSQFFSAMREAGSDYHIYVEAVDEQPKATDFLGAKYYAKAFRDEAVFITSQYDGQVYYYPSVYRQAHDHFLAEIEADDEQVITFLKLVDLPNIESALFYASWPVEIVDDQWYYTDMAKLVTYYSDLLTKANQLYDALDENYQSIADIYMDEILYLVFSHLEEPNKYCANVGLTAQKTYVTTNEIEFPSYTEMVDMTFYKGLRDYLNGAGGTGYYAAKLGELLDNLERNHYYYNSELDALIYDLHNDYLVDDYFLPDSTYQIMEDLDNFYQDLAVSHDSEIPADAVKVGSVTELVEAIKPGATIILEPKTYFFDKEATYKQRYCSLQEGRLVIVDVDDLTIIADGGLAQFVSNQVGDVMYIYNVKNLKIEGLRVGHLVDQGCSGSAAFIGFAKDVTFKNCILFGCGFNGLDVEESSGIQVSDSVISGCSAYAGKFVNCQNVSFDHVFFRENGLAMLNLENATDVALANCLSKGNADGGEALIEAVNSTVNLEANQFGEDKPVYLEE